MLEVKNLVKVYKTKGGVETRALDGVSVNFPETGLVFLLGKSGSGKSTLLNMIGGLDKPDGGEIIVKGRSSKDFSQSDFDSYRNTYIGFIFQEYNVLNEFNIEQNISLALQLQGKKNDREAVNTLLKEVDLEGFNKRKPNTLSGGQKQRIAIARALIKSPEIIMADEPTGALDSNTGKQVLETLKKLSKDKLVIIVSHDQDFAEEYGDRIIELKDGKIISDKSKEHVPPKTMNANIQVINGNIIDIKKGSDLSEADFKQIYQLIKKQDKEVLISTGENNIAVTKKAQRISDDGKGEVFKDTQEVPLKKYDGKETKFIRSHMPFSRSFKMGASGLKTKPVRLIFTILLSVVSFTMFGVASTLMLYNSSYSLSQAMSTMQRRDEAVGKTYALTNRYVKINTKTGETEDDGNPYTNNYYTYVGEQELKDLNNANGNRFIGVFNFVDSSYNNNLPRNSTAFPIQNVEVTDESKDYYSFNYFTGLSDADASFFTSNGYTLIGAHPVAENEIAISNYHYQLIKASGGLGTINNENNLIGKKIKIYFHGKNYNMINLEMKVTGIYNFGEISAEYNDLKEAKANGVSDRTRQLLVSSFEDYLAGSFYTVGYVAPSFYEKYGYTYPGVDSANVDTVYLEGYHYENRPDVKEWDVPIDMGTSIYLQEDIANASVTYYDLEFNEVKDPIIINDNEVLLSYSRYHQDKDDYSKYYEPIESKYSVLNNMQYSAYEQSLTDLINDMNSGDPTGDLAKAVRRLRDYFQDNGGKGGEESSGEYPEGHTMEKDYETATAGFNAIFTKAFRNRYLIQVAGALEGLSLPDFKEKVTDYIAKFYDYSITADEITTLRNNLNDYLEEDSSRNYALVYAAADALNGCVPESYRYMYINNRAMELAGEEYYTLVDNVYNTRGSDEKAITTLKTVFEDCYKYLFGKAFTSYTFDPSFMSLIGYSYQEPIAYYYKDYNGNSGELTVKGFVQISSRYQNDCPVVTKNAVNKYIKVWGDGDYTYKSIYETDYVAPADAKYSYMISKTNYSESDIALFTAKQGSYSYTMTNEKFTEVARWTSMIEELQTIFLIIGAVTGGLAALMLLNFISVSISSKNKDIGILRAVGARGSDVFKIFFSESSIISAICFILSAVAAGIVCYNLNNMFIDSILGIPLLNFSVINIALILGVSLVISFIATFIPVLIASKKPPVEAIRSL